MTADIGPLVLASASPRRRELIGRLGLDVEFAVADIDERALPGEPGPLHALRLAASKAAAVASDRPHAPVLGADTTVVLHDTILGKPVDREDATRFLRRLRGRTHVVVTALCLLHDGREARHVEQASVTFSTFSDEILAWYVATGEGDDKAGAYAVQGRGAILVERVEGNVQAVVGLPLAPIPALMQRVGLELRRSASGGLAVGRRRDL